MQTTNVSNGVYTIPKVSSSHAGTYTCKTTNIHGTTSASLDIGVTDLYLKYKNFEVTYDGHEHPECAYTLYHNGTKLASGFKKVTYTITEVEYIDAGNKTCEAVNNDGTVSESDIIQVIMKGPRTSREIKTSDGTSNQTDLYLKYKNLEVTYDGHEHPECTYTLYHNGTKLASGFKKVTYAIAEVEYIDPGNKTCEAVNNDGTVSESDTRKESSLIWLRNRPTSRYALTSIPQRYQPTPHVRPLSCTSCLTGHVFAERSMNEPHHDNVAINNWQLLLLSMCYFGILVGFVFAFVIYVIKILCVLRPRVSKPKMTCWSRVETSQWSSVSSLLSYSVTSRSFGDYQQCPQLK